MITSQFDYVLDCIDNSRVKSALIAHCRRQKIKLITVGGAGGQIDPSKIHLTDLSRSIQDPLLARVRHQLRHDYGFSSDPKKRFNIPCVWSEEPRRLAEGEANTGLSCAGGLGSVMTVTASFALMAVSHVLGKLAIETTHP